ncbi:MAG: MFS transporter [Nitrososphaerota archaeon]
MHSVKIGASVYKIAGCFFCVDNFKRIYARALLASVSDGAGTPYVPIYAAYVGASSSQLGLLHSFLNLGTNVFQSIWGYLSDKKNTRVPFIIVGGVISSVIWLFIAMTNDPGMITLLVAVQSVFTAMAAPAFVGLIGDLVPASSRAIVSTSINLWTQAGSMFSTLFVGLSSLIGLPGFTVGFIIATVSGLLAAIVMIGFRSAQRRYTTPGRINIVSVTKHIVREGLFLRFCLVNAGFGFFMSIAWPVFTVTLARVAGLTFFEISILTVASGAAGILGLYLLSNATSRIGAAKTLMINRSSLAVLPIVYGLTPSFPFLLGVNILAGVNAALINTAVLLFLIEKTPMEERASFIAFYNLLAGSSYFAGSITGGVMLGVLESRMRQDIAILIVYIVSAVGRLGMGLIHAPILSQREAK